jgi:hypothetical protein
VDPNPEITNSSTDVANHKRATPKTSLLRRAACRSLILFSLCNFMSILYDAQTLDSVYTCRVKKEKLLLRHAETLSRTTITKNTQSNSAQKIFKENCLHP